MPLEGNGQKNNDYRALFTPEEKYIKN